MIFATKRNISILILALFQYSTMIMTCLLASNIAHKFDYIYILLYFEHIGTTVKTIIIILFNGLQSSC